MLRLSRLLCNPCCGLRELRVSYRGAGNGYFAESGCLEIQSMKDDPSLEKHLIVVFFCFFAPPASGSSEVISEGNGCNVSKTAS